MLPIGFPLAPAAITSRSGNPWVAVLYTWGLAQVRRSDGCIVLSYAVLLLIFYRL